MVSTGVGGSAANIHPIAAFGTEHDGVPYIMLPCDRGETDTSRSAIVPFVTLPQYVRNEEWCLANRIPRQSPEVQNRPAMEVARLFYAKSRAAMLPTVRYRLSQQLVLNLRDSDKGLIDLDKQQRGSLWKWVAVAGGVMVLAGGIWYFIRKHRR